MNGMDSRLAVTVAMAVAMLAAAATAQQQAVQPTTSELKPLSQREIVVSLEDRKLALVENGEIRKIYSVAVGKPSTPSPEGTFQIQRRVANPTYHHDGKTVLPGPNNPVGTRWMGLSKTGYGIHGTNEPKSIGKAASHGCIRMARADLEEFYAVVAVGDTVRLIGRPDEETARLFGPADAPTAAAAQPTETAHTDGVAAPAVSDPAPAPAPVVTTVAAMGTR